MNRALLLAFLLATGCVNRPDIPPDIRKETHRVSLGRENVAVDFYHRPNARARPLAVVAHGFLADKNRMAHWAVILARAGFVVAAPTNPTYADDARNTAAIIALAERGRAGRWPISAATDGRVALVGFSRGGLETLLAAAGLQGKAGAWVGLDPVDRAGKGRASAAKVRIPGLALLAEPRPLNANGNARNMLSAYGGPLEIVRVSGAGHLDAESPRRRGRFPEFENRAVRFLRSVFPDAGS